MYEVARFLSFFLASIFPKRRHQSVQPMAVKNAEPDVITASQLGIQFTPDTRSWDEFDTPAFLRRSAF